MAASGSESGEARRDLTPSLIARLRAGDDGAGRLLETLYRRRLFGFCWACLGNVEDAEDAVQDVFCNVLKAKEVPAGDGFKSWLFTVALNVCRNMRRGKRRSIDNQPLPSTSQLAARSTGILTRLAKAEQKEDLHRAFAALTPEQRTALWLYYAEDWHSRRQGKAEVAEILGIRQSVLTSRLCEGLKKLREHGSPPDDS